MVDVPHIMGNFPIISYYKRLRLDNYHSLSRDTYSLPRFVLETVKTVSKFVATVSMVLKSVLNSKPIIEFAFYKMLIHIHLLC